MSHKVDIRRLMRQLQAIRILRRGKKYSALIVKINDLLKIHPFFVPLLVLKGQALQLLENEKGAYNLREAKRVLTLATKIDPKAGDALSELGSYIYAIEGQSRRALGLFERSIHTSLESLKEAQIGRIKCLMDLGRWAHCERALRESRSFLGDDLEIVELEQELREIKDSRKENAVKKRRRKRR